MNRSTESLEEESNIMVAVRVRPMLEKEKKMGEMPVVRVEDNLIVIFDPKDSETEKGKQIDLIHRSREQKYAFDKVYTSHDIKVIYQETVHALIHPLMSGFNGCVFAYGATGTGKTHTMLGNAVTSGLCNLALKDIYYTSTDQEFADQQFSIRVCYVEIYNEMIRDLLDAQKSNKYLDLRDDPTKGVEIAGVSEIEVKNEREIINLLHQGNKRRTTEATNANQTSSRSHAIFQVLIGRVDRARGTSYEVVHSKLSLIDLAGSERGTSTGNRGIRMMEGAKINRSLLALGNCINALGDKAKKGSFVPYRDSKLTRMLKDSLGGNCKTVMIVTISPSEFQFEDTLNTLKYANRAKNIRTKAVENKTLVELHIAEYKNIIEELRGEVDQLKMKLNRTGSEVALRESWKKECGYCGTQDTSSTEKMEMIQVALFENFQERIQIRRALCEITSQNQLNKLEIESRQSRIMRLTSEGFLKAMSPELVEDKGRPFRAHLEIKTEMEDIKTLKTSTDFNQHQKLEMEQRLKRLSVDADEILDETKNAGLSPYQLNYLELVVQNHIFELQNNELEINLTLRAKMNQILSKQLKNVKSVLKENGVSHFRDDEDDEEVNSRELRNSSRLRSASPSPMQYSNAASSYRNNIGSAKRKPDPLGMYLGSKPSLDIGKIKRTSTVEKSEGLYDGDSSSKGRDFRAGYPVRKNGPRAETIEPYRPIEIRGNPVLTRLPNSKHVIRSSNSPSRPGNYYNFKDDIQKENSAITTAMRPNPPINGGAYRPNGSGQQRNSPDGSDSRKNPSGIGGLGVQGNGLKVAVKDLNKLPVDCCSSPDQNQSPSRPSDGQGIGQKVGDAANHSLGEPSASFSSEMANWPSFLQHFLYLLKHRLTLRV